MNRAEMETRVQQIIDALLEGLSGAEGSNSIADYQRAECRAIDDLMALLTEDADNFSCAVSLKEQIEAVEEAAAYYADTYCEHTSQRLARELEVAAKSLRWLDCYMRGRENSKGECVDETGVKL